MYNVSGIKNLRVVSCSADKKVLIDHLRVTFGYSNVAAGMLSEGVAVLLEESKHHLVSISNEANEGKFILLLEDITL